MRVLACDLMDYAKRKAARDAVFAGILEACREPIGQLVTRYGLAGGRLLSVGAGGAFEEAWMSANGVEVVGVDVNPCLGSDFGPGKDRYIVAPIETFLDAYRDELFDTVYISSFHPDEVRREELQRNFISRRSPEDAAAYVTWPAGTKPYHDSLMRSLDVLRDGGLAIFQHYRGGVYLDTNPHYFNDVRRQLADAGCALVEAYCFRASPPHSLFIAIKGTEQVAASYADHLRSMPPIRTFHGRFDGSERLDIVRVYGADARRDSATYSPLIGMLKRGLVRLTSVLPTRCS